MHLLRTTHVSETYKQNKAKIIYGFGDVASQNTQPHTHRPHSPCTLWMRFEGTELWFYYSLDCPFIVRPAADLTNAANDVFDESVILMDPICVLFGVSMSVFFFLIL